MELLTTIYFCDISFVLVYLPLARFFLGQDSWLFPCATNNRTQSQHHIRIETDYAKGGV